MKISPEQLSAQLKQQVASVYIVSGDEPLRVGESADLIRQHARQQGFSERTVFHVDTGFDWRDFLAAVQSLSLFSEKRLIELRIPNGKPGDEGRKALTTYSQVLSPDNLLLIITGRLEGATQKAKWFKALDASGLFIPIWPIEPNKLPGWMGRRLKATGFEISPEALALLAERIEGNLLAAAQELEKLKLLAKGQFISEDIVRESVSDSTRYDVFHLSDAALAGNVKACIRILGVLKGEGIEPPVILWALTRDIRLLSYISRQLSRGITMDLAIKQAAKTVGFSPFLLKRRLPLINKAIKRHGEKGFRDLLLQAGQIDREIKGLEKSNPWNSLRALSLELAGLFPIASQQK
ncbi:DNA polymerase III subunit delta [Candidatus Sororendozoicomonas aggregata]|uniref:DNA polymerase III subunit delta n=1 Tax=Candidatus Sororendozoicomonas aggregata TaxID=3073239 RepID=UPI002ED2B58C